VSLNPKDTFPEQAEKGKRRKELNAGVRGKRSLQWRWQRGVWHKARA